MPWLQTGVRLVMVVTVRFCRRRRAGAKCLPAWLAAIHTVLPVQAMGELIRGTVAGGPFVIEAGAFLLLVAWAVGSLAVSWTVMTRRG
jgi:ABC-2 type transport system permease protein